MQNKLQELTEKIYQEGVEKGNAEAKEIIEKAKADAAEIISNAKKEAETIIEKAEKKAAETKSNTESEIKLLGKQSINALKQQIVNLITGDIASATIKRCAIIWIG